MQDIKTMEEFHNAKNRKTIFVFTANWCPDCSAIKPIMPTIVEKYSEYEWYYINRDQFPQLGLDLNIFGIPSFIAFVHNKEIGRFVSKLRKNKAEIERFVEGLNVGDKSA